MPTPFHNSSKLLNYLVIVIVLILFCAIFMPLLSRTILYDEAYTFVEYAGSPLRALFLYTTPNNHLLHSFLVWLSTTLFGDNLIGIRLPAFTASLLSIAYVIRVGYRLMDYPTGILAATILMSIPLFMDYASTARGYSLSLLFSLSLFDIVFFGPKYLSRSRQYLLLLNVILLILTLPTMLLFIGALVGWLIIRQYFKIERYILSTYVLPSIFGSLMALFFYSYTILFNSMDRFSGQLGYPAFTAMLEELLRQLGGNFTGIILLAGVLIGIGYGWNHKQRFTSIVLFIILTALGLALVQEVITGRVPFPRNYIYITPFIALTAAVGWSYLLTRMSVVHSILAALILGFVAYNAYSLGQPTLVDQLQTEIESHTVENDYLIIDCCMEYPIYFMNRETSLFDQTDDTERYIFIPENYVSYKESIGDLETPLKCTPDHWDNFSVYICTETQTDPDQQTTE